MAPCHTCVPLREGCPNLQPAIPHTRPYCVFVRQATTHTRHQRLSPLTTTPATLKELSPLCISSPPNRHTHTQSKIKYSTTSAGSSTPTSKVLSQCNNMAHPPTSSCCQHTQKRLTHTRHSMCRHTSLSPGGAVVPSRGRAPAARGVLACR